MQDIHSILEKYWGYQSFRPLQEDIINAVLDGKDTLALLPTGGGKSICFQVPAMCREGICLVVSPLIALMKDQVENLKRRGIPALSIYSGMSFIEVKKTLQNAAFGNYKFLYVSPERLETSLFLEFLPAMNISLLAVDEAHCISQWGYDFRPTYLRIAGLREHLPKTPVLALTASATKMVQDDICEKLNFGVSHQRFQQSFARPNLSYSVFNAASKQNKLLEILKNVPGTAIVYCKSRKHTKETAELLRMNNINADFYHAGLSNDVRNDKQNSWIQNKTRVIVCTNAFGMGIDKPDVRVVVHYEVPDCLENYYQEAGRAGRDGKRAYAVMLYSERELIDLKKQRDIRFPSAEEIKKVYTAMMNQLQVPAGNGEGISYDFDMAAFAGTFKLNILTATYAMKAMEQEGLISYNEVFFKPSTVVFTVDKDELNDFEKTNPALETIIKGLLRMYEGVFDFPATVYESGLAKFIQLPYQTVKQQLQILHDHKIIQYNAQKDSPQIYLLMNRMYSDSFRIDLAAYSMRKANYEKRVEAIVQYTEEVKECRSTQIASYFGDPSVKSCGICDNCINYKEVTLTTEEFTAIEKKIIELIKDSPMQVGDLFIKMKGLKKAKIWKVIDFLQSEGVISSTKNGEITNG